MQVCELLDFQLSQLSHYYHSLWTCPKPHVHYIDQVSTHTRTLNIINKPISHHCQSIVGVSQITHPIHLIGHIKTFTNVHWRHSSNHTPRVIHGTATSTVDASQITHPIYYSPHKHHHKALTVIRLLRLRLKSHTLSMILSNINTIKKAHQWSVPNHPPCSLYRPHKHHLKCRPSWTCFKIACPVCSIGQVSTVSHVRHGRVRNHTLFRPNIDDQCTADVPIHINYTDLSIQIVSMEIIRMDKQSSWPCMWYRVNTQVLVCVCVRERWRLLLHVLTRPPLHWSKY